MDKQHIEEYDIDKLQEKAELTYSVVESWHAQFVKNQEDFVINECIKFLSNDKSIRNFRISEDELRRIFLLGLNEYKKIKCFDNYIPHID